MLYISYIPPMKPWYGCLPSLGWTHWPRVRRRFRRFRRAYQKQIGLIGATVGRWCTGVGGYGWGVGGCGLRTADCELPVHRQHEGGGNRARRIKTIWLGIFGLGIPRVRKPERLILTAVAVLPLRAQHFVYFVFRPVWIFKGSGLRNCRKFQDVCPLVAARTAVPLNLTLVLD